MHIGELIKKERESQGLSAEFVGKRLSKPITKQAFLYREKNGSFEWNDVIEVADILGVKPKKFLLNGQI